MFASKNTIVDSMLDGLGMGIGFTMALFLIGLIREFFGGGTAFGIELMEGITPMGIFMLAPGGFFVLAMIIAAINWLSKGRAIKKKEIGCDGCPMIDTCSGICEKEEAGV